MSDTIFRKIKSFFQKDSVLAIASVLALLSCFFVHPDRKYIDYINLHTLILLFCLMTVMAGLKELGLFRYIGEYLLGKVHSQRSVAAVLTALCFISSMFITNDVALITFVPFGILVLKIAGMEHRLCLIITLMTIAANLGSMLTPIGNPQNLYLYSISDMSLPGFLKLMLPYTLLSAILLALVILFTFKNGQISVYCSDHKSKLNRRKIAYYLILFLICLLCVAGFIQVFLLLPIILAAVLLENKSLLRKVDYSLLLTFTAFFIFIGNMGRIPAFNTFIAGIVQHHEVPVSILSSQIVSNVPAALLLSGFTNRLDSLIIGTNLGGLGTLIASMASLISYKAISSEYSGRTAEYLRVFTLWNIVFLVLLLGLYFSCTGSFSLIY